MAGKLGRPTREDAAKKAAKDALLEAIDKAGELQAEQLRARNAYEAHREVLKKMITDVVGEDVTVQGQHYEAIVKYDSVNFIDPNEFIEKVSDPMIRFLCLKVTLKDANSVLGRVNRVLLNSLVKLVTKPEPTLHVDARTDWRSNGLVR